MAREQVLQILKRKSVPIVSTTEGYELNASGFYPLTSVVTPLRDWKAVLKFPDDVLTELEIGAG